MNVAVALGWIGCCLGWAWSRRPLPVPPELVAPVEPAGRPSLTSRLGAAAQRRLPLLAELPAVAVGIAVAAAVVGMVVAPMGAFAVAIGVVTLARARSIGRRRRLARTAARQVPEVVELIGLCLASGLSPRAALDRVAPLVHEPLGHDLRRVAAAAAGGERLVEALAPLAADGHPLRPLALVLASAERSGVAVSGALDRLAREARTTVRRASEAQARRLPVVMLLPLVGCVLPAFGLVTIAPLLLGRLGSLL